MKMKLRKMVLAMVLGTAMGPIMETATVETGEMETAVETEEATADN